jgi:hypothetical protein
MAERERLHGVIGARASTGAGLVSIPADRIAFWAVTFCRRYIRREEHDGSSTFSRPVKLSLWGVTLGVDPFVTQILYGAKLVILFVDVVLLVTFIGTSGWLLGKEIIGWARC